LRKYLGLELLKRQGVTEEFAHLYRQETAQVIKHGPIAFNHAAVGNNAGRGRSGYEGSQPPPHLALPVVVKINPGELLDPCF
jgi:hypothetical protein